MRTQVLRVNSAAAFVSLTPTERTGIFKPQLTEVSAALTLQYTSANAA
jgi:hypothetical protein